MRKRWLWVGLVASLAALLVGCGSASPSNTGPGAVQRLSPQETRALLETGEAVVYDTRTAGAYRIQHAAGATSLPEAELAGRIDELPDDGRVLIFYCT